jgi:hypothetical protein
MPTPVTTANHLAAYISTAPEDERFFHLNAPVEPNNHWLIEASLRMKTLFYAYSESDLTK